MSRSPVSAVLVLARSRGLLKSQFTEFTIWPSLFLYYLVVCKMKLTGPAFGLLFVLCFCSLSQIQHTEAANILFYFGVSSYSHRISVWPLVTALADRGHNVTFSTIYRPKEEHKHPKVREFFPKEFEDAMKAMPEFDFDSFINVRINEGRFAAIKMASQLPTMGLKICDLFLSTKATQDWIKHSKYDLVIVDALFNDCGYGLAHIFGAKTIIFGTTSVFSWLHDPFGFPAETSWIPELHLSFPYPMAFHERLISTMMPLLTYYQKVWSFYPELDSIFQKTLKVRNMPPVVELEKEASLVLLSSHYSEEFARSLPPLVVPVGGIHLAPPTQKAAAKSIPADMAKFMDESGPAGFVYVSFGSAVSISHAVPEFQQRFFTAFKNSKTRFLWKWEGERPKEMPANVFTAKWMPQQQVLSHPKVKAFITHAGLMGATEAITHAVPLVMFPFFAEQDYNSFRFEREKRGIMLNVDSFTSDDLQKALTEILTNPIYKQNMVKTKKLFEDRPDTPLNTAIWWTEYVLRHDDLSSMKPLAMNQMWYERRLLDVWAFLAGIIISVLLLTIYVLKKVLSCIFCRGSGGRSSSSPTKAAKAKGGSKVKKS